MKKKRMIKIHPLIKQHTRTCRICFYRQEEYHNMGEYKHDASTHYKICAQCGYKQSGSHILTGGYTWTKIGAMFECRKKVQNWLTCNANITTVDKNHTINSATKKCTKCGYYRGY